MEYYITIIKEGNWYFGYNQGEYISDSCALTKLGCKHNIKKKYTKPREKVVEEYILKV